ncbi:MAG: FHA domain-containing protein [Myxococcales bacterium]|nr:FHA domain-containing protein [Myxococcales bacterium]
MAFDKLATIRRSSEPPVRRTGAYIVYLGLTPKAAERGLAELPEPRIGDSFRLLPGAAITFGKSRLCEVTLPTDDLSRAHAMISFVPGDAFQLLLVDLLSKNGTWVEGRSAPLHYLGPGGEFELARCYRFRCQPAP